MKSSQSGFSISGKWFTVLVRDLVLESRWEDALSIAMESMSGIGETEVIAILRGDKRLVGVNNMTLEDELEEVKNDYLNRLNYLYRGILKFRNSLYTPYAIVSGWGPDDADFAMKHYLMLGPRHLDNNPRWNDYRSMYYADNVHSDLLFTCNNCDRYDSNHVLWKLIDKSVPYWVKRHTDVNDAYLDYLREHGRLETRGYAFASDDTNPDESSSYTPKRKRTLMPKTESKVIIDEIDCTRDNESSRKSSIEFYRNQIVDATGDNWLYFNVAGLDYRLPNAAFENYCLWRTAGAHLAERWNQISPVGYKGHMIDDRYHTDWVLGFQHKESDNSWSFVYNDPKENYDKSGYDDPLMKALYDLQFSIQKSRLGFQSSVLSGTGSFTGNVVHPSNDQVFSEPVVIVIPNGGPDWAIPAMSVMNNGGAIITCAGGAVCHLATIGRENDMKLVRVEDGLKRYTEGMIVTVDCDKGMVVIDDNEVRGLL